MKYYFDILDSGTLVTDLIETITDRQYGNGKEYVKHRMTVSYLGDGYYFEDRCITSTVWNWKTVKHYYLGKKDI